MKEILRILFVEDVESDAALTIRLIENEGYKIIYQRVDSADLMRIALKEKRWDIVIADYRMPNFSAVSALSLLKENGLDIPFIVVSGAIGEETAVAMMQYGAQDYIMKGNLSRLVPALERELRDAEVRKKRKQAEEEKERLTRELYTQKQELLAYTYTLSHDLKNPLLTVKGFLDLLKRDVEPIELKTVQTSLAFIEEAVSQMEGLLRELVDFSRIDQTGRNHESISFNQLTHETAMLLDYPMRKRGVKMTITQDNATIMGDPIRLKQVMLNLLSNAIKFMGDQPDPRIRVDVRHESDGPVFCIEDNGIGIKPEYKNKIFGIFKKIDPGTEGTGVGLAIVKRIIQIHDGRVWVESEGINKGSVFCFTLPTKVINIQNNGG